MARRFLNEVLKFLLICILISVCLSTFELQVKADDMYPIVPDPGAVSLSHYRKNGSSYVMVYIELPGSGCFVQTWGSTYTSLNYIFVNAQIWERFPDIPVIIPVSHTYDLGALPSGNYTFIFMVWQTEVKRTAFAISSPQNLTVPDDYPTIQEAINAAGCGDNIFVRNGTYNEQVIINKTISLIGEDRDITILNGTTIEPMMIVEADDVRINGFTFEGWAFRNIVVNATSGAIIAENKIVFNALGIDVENSVNTTIENNVIDGFGLDSIGIMLAYSSECRIVNNTITNAVYDGIRLWFASNNWIHQNLVRTNDYGIFFHEANLNTISENTISESGGPGIYLESSLNNKVLHSNFIDNYYQAKIFDNSVNAWDNGFEGNYWSDYTSSDLDNNGIGDSPYVIDGNNQDNYPLMSPFIEGDANHDAVVNIGDVSLLAVSWLSHEGEPSYNPHVDLNMDGAVDIRDATIIGINWLKKWENP